MSSIRAIGIDLFSTLVHIDPDRYPTVLWKGKPRFSSAPKLFDLLRDSVAGLELDRFVSVSIEVQDELEVERRIEYREIASIERFRRTLQRVGVDVEADGGALLEKAQTLHIETLIDAARIPESNLNVLADLSARWPVALVSNFDDGAACRRLLARQGIAPFLNGVVISEEVGWRKPHPLLFERAAESVGHPCEEMVFIGDNPIDDINGARAVGMHPIWIPGPVPPPEDWVEPVDRVSDLRELLTLDLIGGRSVDGDD